jgi:hypothetical protein
MRQDVDTITALSLKIAIPGESNYEKSVCLASLIATAIDLVVYGTVLLFVLLKGARGRFGCGTMLMLSVPILSYLILVYGQINYFVKAGSQPDDSIHCAK